MANAWCINAYNCDWCLIQTLWTLDSANIWVWVQFCAPDPLDDKRLDYIKYTDKCWNTCCLSWENEILIYATQWTLKNLTLTNDDTNEVVNVKRTDVFWSNRKKTVVRYKTWWYPTSITDWTLAVEELVQNQYQSSWYNVSWLSDATTYYFSVFAVAQDDTIIVVQSSNITTDFFLWKYQAVEYIQSSWTQRINTWIAPNDAKFWILWKFRITTIATSVLIDLSNTTSTDNKRYWFQFNGWNSKPQWSWIMYQQRWEDNWTIDASTDYEFSYNYNWNASFTINWMTKTWISVWSNIQMPSWYIFCQNCNWSFQRPFSWRLYRLQLYHNTELLRDFRPCYRKSDNVIWLLDVANKQFYTNSWSWTFTKWSNIPR